MVVVDVRGFDCAPLVGDVTDGVYDVDDTLHNSVPQYVCHSCDSVYGQV